MNRRGFTPLIIFIIVAALLAGVVIIGTGGYLAPQHQKLAPSQPVPTDKYIFVPTIYLLSDATVGQQYSALLQENVLSAILTENSSLPSGLSIQEDAMSCRDGSSCSKVYHLTGIPTHSGKYTFSVRFHGQNGSGVESYTITIHEGITPTIPESAQPRLQNVSIIGDVQLLSLDLKQYFGIKKSYPKTLTAFFGDATYNNNRSFIIAKEGVADFVEKHHYVVSPDYKRFVLYVDLSFSKNEIGKVNGQAIDTINQKVLGIDCADQKIFCATDLRI